MMSPATHRPITYLLPTTAWAPLLDIITRDAPPSSVIEVQTEAMQQVTVETLARYGRTDVAVQFRPPTPAPDHTP